MVPLIPTSDHQPEGGIRDAVVRHSDDGGLSLARRWGKLAMGVPEKLFYRSKSPSMSRTTSQIIPSTESNILQEFIEDLIWIWFSVLSVFLWFEVSFEGIRSWWCSHRMKEPCQARAEMGLAGWARWTGSADTNRWHRRCLAGWWAERGRVGNSREGVKLGQLKVVGWLWAKAGPAEEFRPKRDLENF
jgi:hypothetical protein